MYNPSSTALVRIKLATSLMHTNTHTRSHCIRLNVKSKNGVYLFAAERLWSERAAGTIRRISPSVLLFPRVQANTRGNGVGCACACAGVGVGALEVTFANGSIFLCETLSLMKPGKFCHAHMCFPLPTIPRFPT